MPHRCHGRVADPEGELSRVNVLKTGVSIVISRVKAHRAHSGPLICMSYTFGHATRYDQRHASYHGRVLDPEQELRRVNVVLFIVKTCIWLMTGNCPYLIHTQPCYIVHGNTVQCIGV
jgi:hypothetical protein